MKKEIDFIGIGTIKSGTSFLSDLLMQHPDILWASKKEINYFNRFHIDKTPNELYNQPISFYYQFFQHKKYKRQIQGEFSPIYIHEPEALKKISDLFPNIKIIIVLRNPVERAYSHFLYAQRFLKIIPSDLSFSGALEDYPFLKQHGLYGRQLEIVYSIFRHQNVKILFFEDLTKTPLQEIAKVYAFLGLRYDFQPVAKIINASKEIKNPILNALYSIPGKLKTTLKSHHFLNDKTLHQIYRSRLYRYYSVEKDKALTKNSRPIQKEPMDPIVRQYLSEYYIKDVTKLERLTNKTLTQWKK